MVSRQLGQHLVERRRAARVHLVGRDAAAGRPDRLRHGRARVRAGAGAAAAAGRRRRTGGERDRRAPQPDGPAGDGGLGAYRPAGRLSRRDVAPEDFDPQRLTTDASINRLVIAELPGVPARLAGRQAHAILSAEAIAAVAAERGVAVRRVAIADDLGVAMHAADPRLRTAARAAATEVGLRLACLLSTLRDPGTASAQGWNPWRRAYLRHWSTVADVHLAGGLLAGHAGPAVVEET